MSMGLVALLSFLSINTAIITEITSLQEVVVYLRTAAEEAAKVEVESVKPLCALDIDFTLTRPAHPATDPQNFQTYAKLFTERINEEGFAPEEVMYATTLTDQHLMESNTKETLLELKGLATVVGLTARYAGKFAHVIMEEHTAAMLEGFETSFEGSLNLTFDELAEHRGYKPALHKGILFCNGEKGAPVTKPEVLDAYINAHVPYTKIIVVDDTKKHLDDCERHFAKKPGVEFQGFHYVRATKEKPRACSEEEFLSYLEELIRFLKPDLHKQRKTSKL